MRADNTGATPRSKRLLAVGLAAAFLWAGCASDPYDRSGGNRRKAAAQTATRRQAPQVERQTATATPVPRPTTGQDGQGAEPPPPAVVPAAPPKAAPPVSRAEIDSIAFGEYSALVIGNNAYHHLPKLMTPHSDADAIAELLRDAYGFSVTVVKDATRSEVMAELSRYRRTLAASDNLLIYYAGHGWNDLDAEEAYWLPVDAREDDQTAWISNSTITQMIRAMQAKHVMVIADSCYSGTLTRGIQVQPRAPGFLERLAQRRSRTALTSGGNEPVADSGGGGHSVFSGALLDVLRENDGVLDATGLYSAVRRPVMLNARQTPQYGDIRFAGHEDGDFLFVRRGAAGEAGLAE